MPAPTPIATFIPWLTPTVLEAGADGEPDEDVVILSSATLGRDPLQYDRLQVVSNEAITKVEVLGPGGAWADHPDTLTANADEPLVIPGRWPAYRVTSAEAVVYVTGQLSSSL